MMPLTLYGNRFSGHSYKVRLALSLAGIRHAYIHVDLALPREQRPEDFRAASRFGEVPVLLAGEQALCQSNAILQWLAERHPALAGANAQAVREWLCWEANRIGFSVPNLRFSRGFHSVGAEVEAWLEARARADLAELEQALAERDYLAGDEVSIADLSASAYLWWLADAGLDIAHWPHVAAWLARIAALPGWRHPDTLMAPVIPA